MADMKKTVWLMVLVLAGCKAGGTVYPEIDAAGMQETVSTAYLAFLCRRRIIQTEHCR